LRTLIAGYVQFEDLDQYNEAINYLKGLGIVAEDAGQYSWKDESASIVGTLSGKTLRMDFPTATYLVPDPDELLEYLYVDELKDLHIILGCIELGRLIEVENGCRVVDAEGRDLLEERGVDLSFFPAPEELREMEEQGIDLAYMAYAGDGEEEQLLNCFIYSSVKKLGQSKAVRIDLDDDLRSYFLKQEYLNRCVPHPAYETDYTIADYIIREWVQFMDVSDLEQDGILRIQVLSESDTKEFFEAFFLNWPDYPDRIIMMDSAGLGVFLQEMFFKHRHRQLRERVREILTSGEDESSMCRKLRRIVKTTPREQIDFEIADMIFKGIHSFSDSPELSFLISDLLEHAGKRFDPPHINRLISSVPETFVWAPDDRYRRDAVSKDLGIALFEAGNTEEAIRWFPQMANVSSIVRGFVEAIAVFHKGQKGDFSKWIERLKHLENVSSSDICWISNAITHSNPPIPNVMEVLVSLASNFGDPDDRHAALRGLQNTYNRLNMTEQAVSLDPLIPPARMFPTWDQVGYEISESSFLRYEEEREEMERQEMQAEVVRHLGALYFGKQEMTEEEFQRMSEFCDWCEYKEELDPNCDYAEQEVNSRPDPMYLLMPHDRWRTVKRDFERGKISREEYKAAEDKYEQHLKKESKRMLKEVRAAYEEWKLIQRKEMTRQGYREGWISEEEYQILKEELGIEDEEPKKAEEDSSEFDDIPF